MSVCVLLTQGAPLKKKVLQFAEEDARQQSSIYVHPLQHLHRKKLVHPTERDRTENSRILVANVGSVFQLEAAYVAI